MAHAARAAPDLPLPSVIPRRLGRIRRPRRRRRRRGVPGPAHHRRPGFSGRRPARHHRARRADRRPGRPHQPGPAGTVPPGRRPRPGLGRPPRPPGARRAGCPRPSRRPRPAARRRPAAAGRRRRRHCGAARWPQPRRRHPDQHLDQHHPGAPAITGLIDFGDMHHTAHVCDLAVTLTSVVRNTAGPAAGGHLGPGRRRPDRLPAAPPADPAGGRRPR